MTATSREQAPDAIGASMTAKAHPGHDLIIGLRIAIIATRPPLRRLRLLRAISSRPGTAMPVFDRVLFEANPELIPHAARVSATTAEDRKSVV